MISHYRPTIEEFSQGVDEYIGKLKSMQPDEAKKIARQTLFETGVIDESGKTKEQIVTGDFFGW